MLDRRAGSMPFGSSWLADADAELGPGRKPARVADRTNQVLGRVTALFCDLDDRRRVSPEEERRAIGVSLTDREITRVVERTDRHRREQRFEARAKLHR